MKRFSPMQDGYPADRLYILLMLQNMGMKRAWGEVEIGFHDRTVKIPIDSLPPTMKQPFYWVVEITDLKWLVEGKALPEAAHVKWKKLHSK